MPVECNVELKVIDQERFHAVDKTVMRLAFDLHNEVGRFFGERVYQDELVRRCEHAGFEVNREVRLRAVHTAFCLEDDSWEGTDPAAQNLKDTLSALLADLGAFLDIGLYREALLHLMRGSAVGIRPVEIKVSGRVVGAQSMCMLDEDTAWHLSGIRNNCRSYESHLIRLLNHTSLNRIQWVNLHNHIVTLKTLHK